MVDCSTSIVLGVVLSQLIIVILFISKYILLFEGTLTRCIDSLEQQDKEASVNNGSSSKDNHSATSALKKILNTAYLINVQVSPGNAFLRSFLDKMKQV